MFKKLNVTLPELDTDLIKDNSIFSRPTFKEFSINDQEQLFAVLNKQFEFGIMPDVVNITEISYPGSGPHTDSWPVAVNFYCDVNNGETCFWENSSSDETSISGLIKAYNTNGLQKINFFTANKGDCYLLDVGKIHSVEISIPNTTRKILRLCWWKHSFDEILKSIKIKNN